MSKAQTRTPSLWLPVDVEVDSESWLANHIRQVKSPSTECRTSVPRNAG